MIKQTLYDTSIPIFIQYLSNLIRILEKAKRFSSKKKVSEKKIVGGKLAPDMYNLVQQVGYAYFTALETTTNLSGIEAPQLSYDEKTLAELQASLRKVVAFLKKCSRSKFQNAEKKRIVTFLNPKQKYPTTTYVYMIALPNFFFHVTTAYDILRHLGVPIGKDDYLGLK